ncbi:MAG: ATP-binding protein, partial [Gemmatimonadaceae bacterium]
DSDRDDICVDVDAVDGSDERLPAVARSVLYRVAQEAVSNARRHASPTTIGIRLRLTRDTASLEVLDDGKGFELASASGPRAGIGLFTMQERVSLVDGEFLIDSSPGAGTRVRASIPLHIIPSTSPE